MRNRRSLMACVGLLCVAGTLGGAARADVFYVDATSVNTVRASNGLADWFSGDDGATSGTPTTGATGADDLWRFRTGQGNNGIWEATSSSTGAEDAALLRTTVTNAPLGTYDVYVFYRSDGDANNWKIQAGLNEGSLTLYDRLGVDGIAGLQPFTGDDALNFFPGTAPAEDTDQPLLYALIGQATVTDGTLSVFIDDLPTSSLPGGTTILEHRTWYDGIGYFIDPATIAIESVMSGLATSGSTWSNGQPAMAGNFYQTVSGHTVTVDSPFAGEQLRVASGGTAEFTTSGVDVRSLVVEAGGNLSETVSGDFALGDIFAATLGGLQLDGDVAFNIDAGSDFFLDLSLTGSGSLEFSSGAGSNLWLSDAGAFDGAVRFNGEGDQVRLTEAISAVPGTLEMNSTGANTLYFNPGDATGPGTVIFNQPGTIDHAATLNRLQGVSDLVANAAVIVDMSKGYPDDSTQSEERRFLIGNGGLQGTADITVNGTSVDYSNGGAISHNEFEVGSSGDPTNAATSDYSGTITANNFVDFEMRNHFPNARFVINSNARLEMGHQAIASAHSLQFGEIVINNGGTLEVGFEQTSGAGVAGHHAYKLTLTSSGGRDGSLTLADGATVRMQVNGAAAGEFDSIVANGNVQLDGTLNVLVNPPASNGDNPIWTPTLGDTFDIISIASISPTGDFDGNGTVEPEDYDFWKANFGTGDFDAAAYTVWRDNLGATGGTVGTISGTFDNVTVTDFNGAMAGFAFQVNYSATTVQLEVIAAGAGSGAVVPEPSALALSGLLLGLLAFRRRAA